MGTISLPLKTNFKSFSQFLFRLIHSSSPLPSDHLLPVVAFQSTVTISVGHRFFIHSTIDFQYRKISRNDRPPIKHNRSSIKAPIKLIARHLPRFRTNCSTPIIPFSVAASLRSSSPRRRLPTKLLAKDEILQHPENPYQIYIHRRRGKNHNNKSDFQHIDGNNSVYPTIHRLPTTIGIASAVPSTSQNYNHIYIHRR
ncbi:hypothetical protein LXL04_002319 [Taraxacum kok-saghyz]